MLIKEYRIPLPLSVEEYRVAQLYMIAKKSREESQGTGSGVEILVNEPYSDGPGGSGQYTHKVYHVGRHLPGWLKALLPRTALVVDEEAWNSYPYTKTRYGCPFLGEKFSIEIETKYYNDDGHQVNVFDLSEEDLKARSVDVIDIVKDQLWGSDYVEEEDPKTFVSEKTGRGPLGEDWIETGFKEDKIMCAYKLCRVEFRFWGFQGRGERFIHDTALRRVMLRAHRQAWAWQDEWFSLTMDDIRKLEKETQDILAQKMSSSAENESDVADATPSGDTTTATNSSNPSKTSEQSSSKGVQKSEVQRNKSSESSEDEFVDAETA